MDRRTLLKAAALTPVAAALPLATGALSPAAAAPRRGATLASGLNFPWGLGFLPDGSALVTERNSGRVLHVSPTGGFDVVGTVPGVVHQSEDGCLGLAVSPTYATDKRVYIYYSTAQDNRVAWFTYDGGTLGAPHPILTGIPHHETHNGGGLWFTDYPSLYVTCGDTRNSALAQNKSSLAGKILRVKPDGTAQTGNPFIGKTGDDRIFSFGHRNPEGITIGDDKRVWSSELGENTWDELNRIRVGRNYGWPKSEGADGAGGFTDPIAQFHPDVCSPSGCATLFSRVWIGALRGQSLWSVDIFSPGVGTKVRYFHNTFGRIRNVKRAPDNKSLWITTSNGGDSDKVVHITFG
jgi:glucose/arabinose dehydrogenase